MLTAADVADYRRHGYLPGRRLLTPQQAEYFRAGCDRCCGPARKDGIRRQASNRVKPYLLFPWAAQLVRHPQILDTVEDLIGPDILVYHTTVWLKEPQSNEFVPWHQDATYFGLAPFEQVTAWVALTDSTIENGCLQVLPGSHQAGQRPHKDRRDERAMLSRGQTLTDQLDEGQAINLLLSAGDVSFHHTLLMHRSSPNRSRTRRIGIGVSYIPTHVRHIGETRLSASLVRGEDRYNHFDSEPIPEADDAPAAAQAHADALKRFQTASESIPEMALAH
ncbi:MAG: phytanoyl-CoA dioxygenase family protein [Gammaproteobacteria bacterium]|nr:phytanoyl-CoA dioxygenase family protein [Gammaproteobacteria bacterium]